MLAQWAAAFAEELHLETGDPVLDTRWRIENERLFVWCDPEPVSMASTAGPTPSGIRIGLVYTPIEHRGHGYAPACVAALSQRLLQAGRKRIYLFVDADNPITQVMYRSIGFHVVCDWMEHDLIRLKHNED